jgi:hypothetical protein
VRSIAWKELLGLAVVAAFGGAVGAGIAIAGVEGLSALELTPGRTVFIGLTVLTCYMVGVAVHEAGHLVGGVLADFRRLLYIAGPLRIEWRPDGRRVGLNRSIMLAGGLVASAPIGLHDLRRRTVVMVAGGPLASLIFGAQALAVWHAASPSLLRDGASFAAQWLGIVLLALGLSSMLIGVITLFPGRTGGFYSDGARIMRLLRTGEDVEKEVALMAVTGLAVGGERPRDWDPRLVARCADIRDGGPFEVGGRFYAFLHAVDRDDVDVAREHATFVVSRLRQLPRGSRGAVLLPIATFHALMDDDVERARSLAAAARQSLLPLSHQRALAEAAIRLADGDPEGARMHARAAIRLAESAMDRGAAHLDIALAERILDRAAAAGA